MELNKRLSVKMESEIMVFVYGTLKRGQPQNDVMMDTNTGKAELITKAISCRSFPLVIASNYNIPFLLDKPGTGYVSKPQCPRQFIIVNFPFFLFCIFFHSFSLKVKKCKNIHFKTQRDNTHNSFCFLV